MIESADKNFGVLFEMKEPTDELFQTSQTYFAGSESIAASRKIDFSDEFFL